MNYPDYFVVVQETDSEDVGNNLVRKFVAIYQRTRSCFQEGLNIHYHCSEKQNLAKYSELSLEPRHSTCNLLAVILGTLENAETDLSRAFLKRMTVPDE
jgi:hypothetical protein